MLNTEKLKPCPFCRNQRPSVYNLPFSVGYKIHCGKCGADSGRRLTPKEAIQAWNERKG